MIVASWFSPADIEVVVVDGRGEVWRHQHDRVLLVTAQVPFLRVVELEIEMT
jgi:hypothetical protein